MSSGAPSGVVEPREGHEAARLAHDQLRRGDVDRAAAPQRDHPVEPRRRHLADRRGHRAERAQAVGAARPARRRRRAPSAGRRTRCRAARAARRCRGARRRRPGSRALVEPRALAAPRDPLLARARSRRRSRRRRRPSSARRATAIEIEWCGSPRLALTEPSIGSTTTSTSGSPKSIVPRSSLTAVKRRPSSCSALELARTPPPRRRRRSPACGRRPRRACRPRAPARAVLGAVGEDPAQRVGRAAAQLQPVRVLRAIRDPHRAYPTVVSLTPRQLEAVTHPGGPLLVLGGAGTGKTTVLCERFAWLVREQGLAPESILALTVSAGRRRRAARAPRVRARRRLRGADRHHRPRLLRARPARRGAGGGARPVRHAGHARRPPGDAARADRRAAARLARHPRQPEPAARLDRRPHRPPQGRARLARGLRRVGGDARRRRPTASASSPPSTPPTTAGCRSRARATSATSCSTPSACCARSPACARG